MTGVPEDLQLPGGGVAVSAQPIRMRGDQVKVAVAGLEIDGTVIDAG